MAADRDAAASGRQPTSHERRAGQPWDASYVDGPAPWDTGQPQPAIVRLAGEGAFAGAVLDAGCGTGENALHLAALGLRVVGVDVAETALSTARRKAAVRGLDADFVAGDALHLDRLDRVFETVLDCGLFHTFDDDERRAYVASRASVTAAPRRRVVVRGSRERTRWLATAEADHGRADASAENGTREPGAGAAVAKESRSRTATDATAPGRARTVFGRVARDTVSDGACGV